MFQEQKKAGDPDRALSKFSVQVHEYSSHWPEAID